ncbi:YeeE/YedE thiosulfate transporter family protein [Pararhodobacter sp. SW119]|uniref:YeeE/YedE family protein n=1 Tax=Pararhodobacter sp. SW119 TaxID=2780075 RepID=UPI001ADEE065|nr:YeeE/YedE thiosulfate transporter family protein [Pararhodobacter sp. SW119]
MGPITPTEFTPWLSLGGGILIGLSAVMVMALFGRIAGISGIARGALSVLLPSEGVSQDRGWRVAFVLGLLAAPLAMLLVGAPVEQTVSGNLFGMMIAGLLVGVGTAIGSGCTSGHGVCGLARLSPRSAVAVVTFMVAAAATVFILRHVLGGA